MSPDGSRLRYGRPALRSGTPACCTREGSSSRAPSRSPTTLRKTSLPSPRRSRARARAVLRRAVEEAGHAPAGRAGLCDPHPGRRARRSRPALRDDQEAVDARLRRAHDGRRRLPREPLLRGLALRTRRRLQALLPEAASAPAGRWRRDARRTPRARDRERARADRRRGLLRAARTVAPGRHVAARTGLHRRRSEPPLRSVRGGPRDPPARDGPRPPAWGLPGEPGGARSTPGSPPLFKSARSETSRPSSRLSVSRPGRRSRDEGSRGPAPT